MIECWNYISIFFSAPFFEPIGNFFTVIGILGSIIAVLRFAHNSRIENWQDNVSIQDYPADYDVELFEKNAIYSKIWTETPDAYMSTVVFKPKGMVISKLMVIKLDADRDSKKRLKHSKRSARTPLFASALNERKVFLHINLGGIQILVSTANIILAKTEGME